MKETIDAAALGGTLFVPAIHKHLEAIARGAKFPHLRSMVIDTEDGIGASDMDAALEAIQTLLVTLPSQGPLCFLRPRTPEVLAVMLAMEGIETIDGFVLPKFGLANAEAYLKQVGKYRFMPSIEGKELFHVTELVQLRDILLPYSKQIIALRFGAEDMLRQLGLRRECDRMLYDMCAPSQVIAQMLMVFKPAGFEIAAPVYRCYGDTAGFAAEVRRDLAEGLVSKSIIHPNQIDPIEGCYRVSISEYEAAVALLEHRDGVFALQGEMAETATQRRWAQGIVMRKEIYGVIPELKFTEEER